MTVRIADLLALDGADFVDAFYRRLLGREADDGGLAHHIALLDHGVSKVDILRSILKTDECARHGAMIKVEGLELLDPPASGRKGRNKRQSPAPAPLVTEPAATPPPPAPPAPPQPDASRKPVVDIGGMLALDNATFVHAFYEQLLGRPADTAGLNHHLALLERGETKVGILRSILQSGEYQDRASTIIVTGQEHLEFPRKDGWSARFQKMVKH